MDVYCMERDCHRLGLQMKQLLREKGAKQAELALLVKEKADKEGECAELKKQRFILLQKVQDLEMDLQGNKEATGQSA
jgi:hypothetical protein